LALAASEQQMQATGPDADPTGDIVVLLLSFCLLLIPYPSPVATRLGFIHTPGHPTTRREISSKISRLAPGLGFFKPLWYIGGKTLGIKIRDFEQVETKKKAWN
jgi:hypothetical protein